MRDFNTLVQKHNLPTAHLGAQLSAYSAAPILLEGLRPVQDNVAYGSNYVTVGGNNRHVIGYLQDFLFSPARARSPVKVLSGGERNRLLLARLFTKPSNVLVLDEPTNDLDIETLDLLEELLMEYSGTVLLVSHDREFINNVVTSTLVFEGGGRVTEFVGGYDDWQRQSRGRKDAAPAPVKAEERADPARPAPEKRRKLSFGTAGARRAADAAGAAGSGAAEAAGVTLPTRRATARAGTTR